MEAHRASILSFWNDNLQRASRNTGRFAGLLSGFAEVQQGDVPGCDAKVTRSQAVKRQVGHEPLEEFRLL